VKKLAVFVEGYTETVFVTKLIEEVSGRHNVIIETRRIFGGSSVPRRVQTITAARPVSGENYFVLIVDCGGDDQVKTRILEEHENLTRNGYQRVIGIRDVYPRYSRSDISALHVGLRKYVKTSLIPVSFVLGVMEVEAWFLAEHSHFERVDGEITEDKINEKLGFVPSKDDMAERDTPAEDLHKCYEIAGLKYEKGGDDKTMRALDFSKIYIELAESVESVGQLVQCLDEFLVGT
jgi:hypothetical protein